MKKQLILVVYLLLLLAPSSAQNILLNPGFEDINNCTEYHMDCSPEAWYNIPAENILVNASYTPEPATGRNVLLVMLDNVTRPKKQVVYTLLGCPLQKDRMYDLVFFLYTGKRRFEKLDIGFTGDEPDSSMAWQVSTLVSIKEEDVLSDYKGGWKAVETSFKATGGERFMLLGNLDLRHTSYRSYEGMNKKGDIICFIDDMILRPIGFTDPCTEFETNKKLAYQQNDRHTEHSHVWKTKKAVSEWLQEERDTLLMPSVYFDINKSVIKKKGLDFLDSLVQHLGSKKIAGLHVIGHTDNTGNTILNDTLSKNRAQAVGDYLAMRLNLSVEQVRTEGKGAMEPVADNGTPAGRERNRRVELIVSYLALKK